VGNGWGAGHYFSILGVALFGVWRFTVFCLPDLFLPIGAKGL
jgi:hypothetical protein